jgi:hypothetical protein
VEKQIWDLESLGAGKEVLAKKKYVLKISLLAN